MLDVFHLAIMKEIEKNTRWLVFVIIRPIIYIIGVYS